MTRVAFSFPLANGLHARPASLLRDACRPFAARVVFRNSRRRTSAAAESVLELVASGTLPGDPCLLEISGPQEKEAGRALRAFVERQLPSVDDGALPPPAAATAAGAWLPPVLRDAGGRCLSGQSLSSGSGRGRAWIAGGRRSLPSRFAAGKKDARLERRLFEEACRRVEAGLAELADKSGATEGAAVLKAQMAILADPGFCGQIADGIANGRLSAGAAIKRTVGRYAAILRRSTSAYLRERAADLNDIASLLAEQLYGQGEGKAPAARPRGRGPFILVAADLSPAELLTANSNRLVGLVLGEAGTTSHTAILARTLAIPAVSLPRAVLEGIPDGGEVVVDGRRGLVLLGPTAAQRRYYLLEEETASRRLRHLARQLRRPAATRDKHRIEIAANISDPAQLGLAWRSGAEGIGLFRSEFLFLDRNRPPDEEEQYASYLQAARSAGDRRLVFRTLDVGGDKPLSYLKLPPEKNPFLGYRAVRFYEEHADLIRCQLRAMLRATGCCGHLDVMVPMVAAPGEIRLVRRLLADASAELRARRVPLPRHVRLGIMVETPAAALDIPGLAREADFFSVGSNDLLQYVMAVDRGNASLSGLYNPLHPAFLRLLRQAARQARRSRRWIGLCGEMAGSRELLPLLVGSGFDELSMAPQLIPAAKERLAQLDSGECRSLCRRVLAVADAGEAAAVLGEFNRRADAAAAAPVAGEIIRVDSASRTRSEAIKELCDLLELEGRVSDAAILEEAVWRREETYATDLGFGFALPHAKSPAVRSASIAFLRPRRPWRWSGKGASTVRGVLLIAVPEAGGEEHLRLIAGLSRKLMHDDFRRALLGAASPSAAARALRSALRGD